MQLNLDLIRQDLYKEIEKDYIDALSAKEKLNSTNHAVMANSESHRYAKEKYAAGKSSAFEYNETRMNWANALSQRAQAKYMYFLKMKLLCFLKVSQSINCRQPFVAG